MGSVELLEVMGNDLMVVNAARLYKLRTSPDAQREIQKYARMVGDELSKKFPVSWAALTH